MNLGVYFDENGNFIIPLSFMDVLQNRKRYGLNMRDVMAFLFLVAKNKPASISKLEKTTFGSRTTKWRIMKKLKAKGLLDAK